MPNGRRGAGVAIGIEREIDDDQWVWHVGLDAQASGVLNDLYQGNEVVVLIERLEEEKTIVTTFRNYAEVKKA